jgi:hypothetical protein
MKFRFLLLVLLMSPALALFAQDSQTAEDKEAAYTRTIHNRAAKIVATLGINDSSRSARVTRMIADQYRNLNVIHTSRDEQINAAKAKGLKKESSEIIAIEEKALARQNKLHKTYIKKLSKVLTRDQVVKVKDGMTYGVVPITYKGYQDMLPNLTEAQKEQILAWLEEAREHAMDAESSEKKHWWFGKYKGRINNYLSAAGYDLKQAGADWEKRRREAAATPQ